MKIRPVEDDLFHADRQIDMKLIIASFRFSPRILTINHFYYPTNALNYIKIRDENLRCVSFKRQLKNHPNMFRIVCDPSSRGTELCLTEITLSGSQIFFVCLVGVWQRNFEPAVCVYGTTGWSGF